jgi:membrane protein implicated in regulation of membrane protease activity
MLSSRGQMLVWVAALVATLFLGIVEITAVHQFRFGYLAATACIAVVLAERVVKSYFKTHDGSKKESAEIKGQ